MFDFPNLPTTGQIVTGPNGATWQWDGVKFIANSSWQGASIVTGDTPPANPVSGALWWDSIGGNLYTWFVDPNGAQWVIANSGGIPDAPVDSNTYARSNQQWVGITTTVPAALNSAGRNLIHNSLFAIQQRGVGPWTANGFTADRWSAAAVTDTESVSLVALADADRTAIGDESAQYAYQNVFTGTTTANAYTQMYQHIENARRLGGKTVTVSFWAKAASGTPKLGVCVGSGYGTGGSPSPAAWSTGQAVTISSTWARYAVTFSVATSVGKTFGTTASTDWTQVEIWYSDGSNAYTARSGGVGQQSGTIQLWGMQLEYGNVATPLVKRDPVDDLQACQRFYFTDSVYAFATATVAAQTPHTTHYLPVTMRATPSVAIVGTPSYANASALSVSQLSTTNFYTTFTITAAGLGQAYFTFAASADL